MLDNLTLILGGARSGKSSFAMNLAIKRQRNGHTKVTYMATGLPCDDEMRKRIEKHKERRPRSWSTFEVGKGVIDAFRKMKQKNGLIIVDCWSFHIANLLSDEGFDNLNEEIINAPLYQKLEAKVLDETNALLEETKNMQCDVVVVSNEVGLGLVPAYPLGRCFRDFLGLSHQALAREALKVFFMVAGLPLELPVVKHPIDSK